MVTDQETIKILNSWKDAVLDSKTKEAFEKAIKAVEIYEKYDWIFNGIYTFRSTVFIPPIQFYIRGLLRFPTESFS